MSRQQRIRRTTLGVLAACCAGVWMLSVVAVLMHPSGIYTGGLMAAVWGSGLGALALTVAACRVADDSTDDPEYFGSIVHGIRAEWQRPSTRP